MLRYRYDRKAASFNSEVASHLAGARGIDHNSAQRVKNANIDASVLATAAGHANHM